jgi:hypothetical protein
MQYPGKTISRKKKLCIGQIHMMGQNTIPTISEPLSCTLESQHFVARKPKDGSRANTASKQLSASFSSSANAEKI